jgi:hypothetical protein
LWDRASANGSMRGGVGDAAAGGAWGVGDVAGGVVAVSVVGVPKEVFGAGLRWASGVSSVV